MLKDMAELIKSEMAAIKGGGNNGKWVYDPETGEWYWIEQLSLDSSD